MSSSQPELEPAAVVHCTAGRLRIRVPGRRHDAAYFERTANVLSTMPGVSRCEANPLTACLVAWHDNAVEEVAAYAQREALFVLDPAVPAPTGAPMPLGRLVQRVEESARAVTGVQVDVRSLAVSGLFALGTLQLLRGQVLAPAVTLFWYGLDGLSKLRAQASAPQPDAPAGPPHAIERQ